eukprot:753135-Hanusia_phi.AAC.3
MKACAAEQSERARVEAARQSLDQIICEIKQFRCQPKSVQEAIDVVSNLLQNLDDAVEDSYPCTYVTGHRRHSDKISKLRTILDRPNSVAYHVPEFSLGSVEDRSTFITHVETMRGWLHAARQGSAVLKRYSEMTASEKWSRFDLDGLLHYVSLGEVLSALLDGVLPSLHSILTLYSNQEDIPVVQKLLESKKRMEKLIKSLEAHEGLEKTGHNSRSFQALKNEILNEGDLPDFSGREWLSRSSIISGIMASGSGRFVECMGKLGLPCLADSLHLCSFHSTGEFLACRENGEEDAGSSSSGDCTCSLMHSICWKPFEILQRVISSRPNLVSNSGNPDEQSASYKVSEYLQLLRSSAKFYTSISSFLPCKPLRFDDFEPKGFMAISSMEMIAAILKVENDVLFKRHLLCSSQGSYKQLENSLRTFWESEVPQLARATMLFLKEPGTPLSKVDPRDAEMHGVFSLLNFALMISRIDSSDSPSSVLFLKMTAWIGNCACDQLECFQKVFESTGAGCDEVEDVGIYVCCKFVLQVSLQFKSCISPLQKYLHSDSSHFNFLQKLQDRIEQRVAKLHELTFSSLNNLSNHLILPTVTSVQPSRRELQTSPILSPSRSSGREDSSGDQEVKKFHCDVKSFTSLKKTRFQYFVRALRAALPALDEEEWKFWIEVVEKNILNDVEEGFKMYFADAGEQPDERQLWGWSTFHSCYDLVCLADTKNSILSWEVAKLWAMSVLASLQQKRQNLTRTASDGITSTRARGKGGRPDTSWSIDDLEKKLAEEQTRSLKLGQLKERECYEKRRSLIVRGESKKCTWTLGKKLGEGGNAEVYRVQFWQNMEFVAVKKQKAAGSKMKEADIMDKLEYHPNIIQFYGVQQLGDKVFIFMEYCPEGTLDDLIKSLSGNVKPGQSCVGLKTARNYTRQIVNGLKHLHARRIVHRDLKPHNLLLSGNGAKVKIADMGEASYFKDVRARTDSERFTVGYAAPEWIVHRLMGSLNFPQLRELHIVNEDMVAKIDIWSLGCIVTEMITGKASGHFLFRGNNILESVELPIRIFADWARTDIRKFVLKYAEEPCVMAQSLAVKDFLDKCFELKAERRPNADQLLKLCFLQLHNLE